MMGLLGRAVRRNLTAWAWRTDTGGESRLLPGRSADPLFSGTGSERVQADCRALEVPERAAALPACSRRWRRAFSTGWRLSCSSVAPSRIGPPAADISTQTRRSMSCDVGGAGHRVQIPRLGTGPSARMSRRNPPGPKSITFPTEIQTGQFRNSVFQTKRVCVFYQTSST